MDFDFENKIKNLGSCIEFSEMNEDMFDYLEDTTWIEKEIEYGQDV